jgi:RNA recognition motif-containing protein
MPMNISSHGCLCRDSRVDWADLNRSPPGESVRAMRNMVTGRGRGFAFVEMASEQDAQTSVSMFNQYSLHGRSLTVNEARPQVERKSGGYRPGGRGRW